MRASVHLCTKMSNYIHDCIRLGRRCSHNRTIIDTLPHLAKQKTHTHIVETYANKKWCTNLNNPSARTSTPKLTNEVLLPHFNACPSFLSQGATSKRRISISVTSVRSCSLSHGCPSKNFRVHHHFPHQIDELKSKNNILWCLAPVPPILRPGPTQTSKTNWCPEGPDLLHVPHGWTSALPSFSQSSCSRFFKW